MPRPLNSLHTLHHSNHSDQHHWITKWMEGICVNSTTSLTARPTGADTHKRTRSEDQALPVSKRVARETRGKRRKKGGLLGSISGNAMGPKDGQSSRRKSPRRGKEDQATFDAHCGRPDTTEGQGQTASFEADADALRTSSFPLPPLTRHPPLAYIPPEIFSTASQTGSTNTDSRARSRSPVKCIADLRRAQKPTLFRTMDTEACEQAGGVLSRFGKLCKIGMGSEVIPHLLRVCLV